MAVFLLAAGLAGTGAAARAVRASEQRAMAAGADRYADRAASAVTAEMRRYQDTVESVAASLSAQTGLSSDDFDTVTETLGRARLAGASGAIFVVPGDDASTGTLQRYWRAQGASTLALKPHAPGSRHYYLVFSRPLDGRPSPAGLDLSASPELAEAMNEAQRAGDVAISGTYVLLKDRALPAAEQQLSFAMAAAVTMPDDADDVRTAAGEVVGGARAGVRLRGWLVMGLRGSDLLRDTMQVATEGRANTWLTASVEGVTAGTDPTSPDAGAVVARVINGPAHDDALVRSETIPVADTRWVIRTQSTDAAARRDSGDGHQVRLILAGGSILTLLLTALVYLLMTSRDRAMAAVDRATGELGAAQERFRFAFDHAHVGMAVTHLAAETDPATGARTGQLLQVNSALCTMLGYTDEELRSRTFLDITHPDDIEAGAAFLSLDRWADPGGEVAKQQETVLRRTGTEHDPDDGNADAQGRPGARSQTFEKRYLHADGRAVWALVNTILVRTSAGTPHYAISQIEDITSRRAETARMAALALQDPLTGLGNRALIRDRLLHAAARTARTGRHLAVLFCDLDDFKPVNDTHGHAAGDELLRQIGGRLRQAVRPADTVARVGGDEFIVLCEELESAADTNPIVSRIAATFTRPFTLHLTDAPDGDRRGDITIAMHASIGIATSAGPDVDVDDLLHRADIAMYADKRARQARGSGTGAPAG